MNKMRATIVALGLALGIMAGVPVAEAAISIKCEKCTCNLDTGTCECTGCTIIIEQG